MLKMRKMLCFFKQVNKYIKIKSGVMGENP